MIYPKLSDGTIDWCAMCKHEGRDLYDGCCECEYPENPDDPPAKYEPEPITNADRLRSMSDEELAEFIGHFPMETICPDNCHEDLGRDCAVCVLDWLKQESPDA